MAEIKTGAALMTVDTALMATPPTKQANSPKAGDNLGRLPAEIVDRDQNLNYPDELTASIRIDDPLYQDESDPLNPVQEGAYIEDHDRGRIEFRGKVETVRRSFVEGGPMVVIEALDKMQVLNDTLALYNDGSTVHKVWGRETPALAISQEIFYAGFDYGDGFRFVWYPVFTSNAWLSTAVLNSTTTSSITLEASATEMRLGADHPGWPPRGFISDAAETGWWEYKGLTYDQAAGIWIAQNLKPDALGSTSADIPSGGTVWGRLPKRIHERTTLEIEGNTGAAWEPIQDSNYEPSFSDGGVTFNQDPLTLRGGGNYTQIRNTYAVYDEEGGSVLLLSALLQDLLETDPEEGGPGFAFGFTDTCRPVITISPEIRLTRVEVREPTACLEFIRKLLWDLQLLKGTDSDAIIIKYHAHEDELRISTVAQKAAGSPDKRYAGVRTRDEAATLELVKTAVVAQYSQGGNATLLSTDRIWHVATSGSPGGAVPYVYHLTNGTWAIPPSFEPRATAAVQSGVTGVPVNLLTDNETNTAFALYWDAAASAQGTKVYGWFPGATPTAPDLHWLDEVEFVFEVIGDNTSVAPGNGFQLTVEGYQTFTGSVTPTPPTAGSAFDLSSLLAMKFTPGVMNYITVKIKGSRIMFPCRALGINVTYPLIDPAAPFSGKFGLKLIEIRATGTRVQTELVDLVGSYTGGNTNELVAPDSFGKLRDATMGQQRVQIIKTGEGTRQVAENFAWLQLLQTLALSQTRDYDVDEAGMLWQGAPIAGETADFGDDFAGIIDSVNYRRINGDRSFGCRAINYLTDLIGAGGI